MKTIQWLTVLTLSLGSFGAFGQRYGDTPEDSVECINNLSIYQEFYKQKNYQDAFEPWVWVYKHCPQNHVNTFIRGSVIVKNKIAKEKDPTKRAELVALLLESWDKRAQLFGNEGSCMGRKAIDNNQYNPTMVLESFQMFKKALELGVGNDYVIPFYYFETAIRCEKAGKIGKEEVIETYDIASGLLEKMYHASPKDTQLFQTLASLDIAFEPYATCEEIIPIFERKYEANKADQAFLEKVCKVLDRKDCTDSDLFFKATEALHSLNPTPKTAYLMAKMCDGKKMYEKVIEYLNEAAKNIENERDKVRAYLLLSKANLNLSRYSDGRQMAHKALEINPNEGKAYIMIGYLYAMSAKTCGDDPQVSQKAAYWAAVDKFRQAKNVDPNCAEEADKLIATYSSHFPSGDDLFFQGIAEGSSYKVGCWIQETVTVRKR